MWPWIPAAVSALGSVGAAIFGGSASMKGQQQANQTNIDLAREQMAFQERMAHSAESFSERMSNTAVRRSIEDYRAAGLNPALAYEKGASSPVGVTAGGAQARVENVMKDAPQIASTALQLKSIAQEIENSKERRKDEKGVMNSQEKANMEAAAKTAKEIQLLGQTWKNNEDQQPHMTRTMAAEATLREKAIAGATNISDFEEMLAKNLKGGSATAQAIARAIQGFQALLKAPGGGITINRK